MQREEEGGRKDVGRGWQRGIEWKEDARGKSGRWKGGESGGVSG